MYASLADRRVIPPPPPPPLQTAATRVYGVVGHPISHSKSPLLHNAALAAMGEDAVYVPLLVHDLPDFFAAFDGLVSWAGLR